MSLKDVEIKRNYDSADDDVVNDFYIPALSQAKYYDRIAGFFTSASLIVSLRGVINIVENGGRIRMLVSPKLSAADANIMNNATENPEMYINEWIYAKIIENDDAVFTDYRNLMAHLIAKGILEIKVVLVKENGRYLNGDEIDNSSIFHQKVGILRDSEGNRVSFSGSINESFTAWNDNIEEFKTFKSWEPGQAEYCESDEKKFQDYWNNQKERSETKDIPTAVREKFIELSRESDFEELKKRFRKRESKYKSSLFDSLFWYQKEAVMKWEQNSYKMLFNMATGTGKTRTALAGIERLLKKEKALVVIATPQSTLSKQWLTEVENLGLDFGATLVCDSSNSSYKAKLEEIISKLNLDVIEKAALFTTHVTASSSFFTEMINNRLKHHKTKALIVGDEVHGLGSANQRKALLQTYDYRIGLSATPSRWYDDEGSDLLINYFGNCSYEFDIGQAIQTVNPITQETFLTPYYYYPVPFYLDLSEDEKYESLTSQISKCRGDDEDIKERRERLLQMRADIVKEAANKIPALKNLLEEMNRKGRIENTLIFTSPKHLISTLKLLDSMDIVGVPLTKDQGNIPLDKYNGLSERQYIIEEFKKKNYQVIVAIKCMDEGIDIPSADTAILMSSTTNPREYIQRIGRVIRRYNGKKSADIYDLIAKSSNPSINKTIQTNELRREKYIAELAKNSVEAIIKIYD